MHREHYPWAAFKRFSSGLLAVFALLLVSCDEPARPVKPEPSPQVVSWPLEVDRVPAGNVWLGCRPRAGWDAADPMSSSGCGSWDPRGEIEVEVEAFYIDRFEVPVARFMACVDAGACELPGAPWSFEGRVNEKPPRQPATYVSLAQAEKLCRWGGGRLPTEAEWLRAARGADQRRFPWGDTPPSCERAAIYECGAIEPVDVDTPTGDVSPFGAWHMYGNVSEWVAPYADAAAAGLSLAHVQWLGAVMSDSPSGRKALLFDETGEPFGHAIAMGISFGAPSLHLSVARRGIGPRDTGSSAIGFRCAYDAAPGEGRTSEATR